MAATIVKNELGTWDFVCGICPPRARFTSTNWRTKGLAEERRSMHMGEHEGAEPAYDSPPVELNYESYGQPDLDEEE